LFKSKLDESHKPIFFFDDDCDGVTSFIQLYKYKQEGYGVCVKGKPLLERRYIKKVEEQSPDKIFVLDKPLIEQEFIDGVTQEIVWLDHHPVQKNKGVLYFNPRQYDDKINWPTSYWVYQS